MLTIDHYSNLSLPQSAQAERSALVRGMAYVWSQALASVIQDGLATTVQHLAQEPRRFLALD